jgi:hypothetical protein
MSNRTKKYGKPLNKYPRIRPVLKSAGYNEKPKPSGEYAIVDGKKEKARGTFNEMVEKL